ncbi:DUF6528 family protein [Paenibacillus sp. P25]|nr:DUF6528 family protein [Paenibacillus sp. P25]
MQTKKWKDVCDEQTPVQMDGGIGMGPAGCSRRLPAVALTPRQAEASTPCGRWIVTTNQATQRIEVYDPAVSDWNTGGALKWSWYPSASNGFTNPTVGWGSPSDARLRDSSFFGGQRLVVTDSRGVAAIIPYPAGNTKSWALNVGGNPHSGELLPSGNIAIAASDGGWVRIYTSSQGVHSAVYTQYDLPGAHSVLWDPANSILWAAGNQDLVALQVGGTAASPTIKELYKVAPPTLYAHDVQPYYYDTDKLWVSTNSAVYLYTKSTKSFEAATSGVNRSFVKAVSNQPSGQVVETKPDSKKSPAGACVLNGWCTDTVDFYGPNTTRTVTGAAFYKARVWDPDYQ